MSDINQSFQIEPYFLKEIHSSSEKFKLKERFLSDLKDFDRIFVVRGDGNCLIRSIICYLFNNRTKNTFLNILMNVFSVGGVDDIGVIMPLFDDGYGWDLEKFIGNHELMELLCNTIRNIVDKQWCFKGSAIYHMDANSIDGLAIEMVMKILKVSELKIYQAFDGSSRKYGWRTVSTDSFIGEFIEPVSVTIITMNGTHYNSLLYK